MAEQMNVLETAIGDHETIINDEEQVFPVAANFGEAVRQGDIYIILREKPPAETKLMKTPLTQLAPGTTQGSRHCLDSLNGVTMYERDEPDALQGPFIQTTMERTITHPEHGDWKLGPGCYEIGYQRMFADELRRVAD